ncbi:uncharacterized protein [Ptychodera flava]|uniref:uncharacterized protein n=1 Tax=Ptychodera flava TaxID=63121 RepID=UPI00396A7F34
MFRPQMYFMMLVVVSSHLLGLVSMQTEYGTGTCDSQGLDCHRSVLILNDEWGTSKGGLSTMNRQIALEAKNAGFEVYVTVLDASEDDIDDAYEKGIKLVKAKIVDSREPNMDWLTIYHPVQFPDLEKIPNLDIIIGHVPLTSEAAISIHKQRLPGTKVYSSMSFQKISKNINKAGHLKKLSNVNMLFFKQPRKPM